jgi:hypothetical protein
MTEQCLANSMMPFHIPRTSLFTHPSINKSIDDTSIWAIVSVIKPQTKEQIQTSLAFSRFVFSASANSMGKPKSKNTTLEPFSGQEQPNYSKTQRPASHTGDVPEVERDKQQSPSQYFCKETNTKNY